MELDEEYYIDTCRVSNYFKFRPTKTDMYKISTAIEVPTEHTIMSITILVESSSNFGLFKLNSGKLSFTASVRSSSPEKQTEILDAQAKLASEYGYKAEITKGADPWQFDPNSELLEIAKRVYKEQNGEEIEVVAVHAGLECGTFKVLKPDLDMVSIGPDLTDGHNINETLYLNSIPRVWRLLEGILVEYK